MNIVSRRRFVRGSVAAAAALGAAPALAQGLEPVTIGIVSSSSDAPFFIADKLGYFKDAGLEAKITTFVGAPQMIPPLGTGQLDVGSGSPSGAFYNGVGRGIGVRLVANKAYSPPGGGYNPLMIRTDLVKSGKYTSPRDLKGMKIAEPAPGGTTAATLNKLLTSVGLTYNDVTHVYMSFPDQIAALTNGGIDGSLLNEPSATLAEHAGAALRVLSNDKWYPDQDQADVIYGANLLTNDRRDIGVRFMTAWLRAARFYMGAWENGHLRGPNGPKVIDILTEATPIKSRDIYSDMTSQAVQPDGVMNERTLIGDLAFYKSAGFLVADVKVPQALAVEYQQAALKQLGPYRGHIPS